MKTVYGYEYVYEYGIGGAEQFAGTDAANGAER